MSLYGRQTSSIYKIIENCLQTEVLASSVEGCKLYVMVHLGYQEMSFGVKTSVKVCLLLVFLSLSEVRLQLSQSVCTCSLLIRHRKCLLYINKLVGGFKYIGKCLNFDVTPRFDRKRCVISLFSLCVFYPSVSVVRLATGVLLAVLHP